MKKKILILSAIAALAAVGGIIVFIAMRYAPTENPKAEIYSNGVLLYSLPLNTDKEITVSCKDGGYNVITVKNGAICVSDADCPDLVCVRTGAVSGGSIPIVCLPHKLEIKIVGGNDG